MKLKTIALIFLATYAVSSSAQHLNAAQKKFAHELAQENHFNEQQVLEWLAKSQPSEEILYRTAHPTEDASWARYRELFVSKENIKDGVAYYKKHRKTLNKAYERFGVDPLAIVAIVGIESHFGKKQGDHIAAKALNTLAFYGQPKRQELFQKQLRALFLLSRKMNTDPLSFKGSYTGALGQPQFMPTTYLYYATSPASNNKLPNLFSESDDVIFSVANYLAQVGWQKDRPITTQVKRPGAQTLQYEENGQHKRWNKSDNFQAIHHYNQSEKYVLAVAELANEIKQEL
jgi:membrane-bound lytic murein transglycosylase B